MAIPLILGFNSLLAFISYYIPYKNSSMEFDLAVTAICLVRLCSSEISVGLYMMYLDMIGCTVYKVTQNRNYKALMILLWFTILYRFSFTNLDVVSQLFHFELDNIETYFCFSLISVYYLEACYIKNLTYFERLLGMFNVLIIS
jgi:hypothetical protein